MPRRKYTEARPIVVALLVLVSAFTVGPGAAATGASSTGETLDVQTAWADPISETSVAAAANVTSIPDNQTATVSIKYRPNGSSTWTESERVTVSSTGPVTVKLSNLDPETEYEYYARATTNGSVVGIATGAIKTFVTPRDSPSVTATGASNVNESAATLTGNVTDLGGSDTSTVFFEYKPSSADDWTAIGQQSVDSVGPVSTAVSGLSASTAYEYRVNIQDEQLDEGLSARSYFTTDDPLVVSTTGATSVTTTSATLTGEIVDFGGSSPEVVGFGYRQEGTSNWTAVTKKPGSSAAFSATIDSLAPGTTYEFRAFAKTVDGDFDAGQVDTLTTVSDPVVETAGVLSTGETNATVSGNLTSLGGVDSAIVAIQYRQGGTSDWSTSANETLSAAGAFDVGLSGLESGTDYEYRAVVTTPDGASETGNVRTFSTDVAASPPAVESVSIQDTSPPNPHVELAVDWAVRDVDADLDSVSVTVTDGTGTAVDSQTVVVGGESATGALYEEIKKGSGETYKVSVMVTDSAGNTATASDSVSTSR